jgi:hypothetical protein
VEDSPLNTVNISIYPNPSSGTVFFELDNESEYKLRIFDVTGREVYSQKGFGKDISWAASQTGLFYYLLLKDGARVTGSFVITR